MDYDSRMASIAAADRSRREAREAAELDALIAQYYPSTAAIEADSLRYCNARNITGQPSENNRQIRVTEDSWSRGLKGRTVGVAHGTPDNTPDTEPMVRVTRNGQTRVETVRSFRRGGSTRQTRQTQQASRRARDIARQADMGTIHEAE